MHGGTNEQVTLESHVTVCAAKIIQKHSDINSKYDKITKTATTERC